MKAIDRIMLIFAEAKATKGNDSVIESVFRKAVETISQRSEAEADELADMFDGALHFNNYLTKTEAERAVSKLRNHDGSEQRKWDATPLFDRLSNASHPIERSGHFNKWALWYVMNLISSDHGQNITRWTDGDEGRYMTICYDMATAKLSDYDKPKFVRWYIGLE